jgi:hypothetical protein
LRAVSNRTGSGNSKLAPGYIVIWGDILRLAWLGAARDVSACELLSSDATSVPFALLICVLRIAGVHML